MSQTPPRDGRLLIVDDQPDNRLLLRSMLEAAGHRVDEEADGPSALRAIAAGDYELVLLDVMMPGMSGLEVLSRLRVEHDTDELMVVVVTAAGDDDTRHEALRLGASDFLVRPVHRIELAARVANLLGLHRRTRALRGLTSDLHDRVDEQARALRESIQFFQDVIDSRSANIAILDQDWRIVRVNAPWREFAAANGSPDGVGEGDVYLRESMRSCADALEVEAGFERILAGELDEFTLAYDCHGPTFERWFLARVTLLRGASARHLVVAHEDVTSLKLVERQLAARERENRALLQATPDTIVVLDRMGTIHYVNRVQPEFSYEQVIGTSAFDYIDPPSAEVLRVAMRSVLVDKEEWVDCEVRMADEARYFSNRVVAYGGGEQVLVVSRDITARWEEQQELERARRDAERANMRLRQAQQLARVGHWEWDTSTDELRWSRELVEMLGVQEDGGGLRALTELVHPDDRPRLMRAMAMASEGEMVSLEYRVGAPAGHLHVAGALFISPSDGHVMLGTLQDITRRKLSEAREREHLRTLELLSSPAVEYLELQPEDDVFALVARQLSEIVGSRVVVMLAEQDGALLRPRAAAGLGALEGPLAARFGALEEIVAEVTPELAARLSGELGPVDGGLAGLGQRGKIAGVLHAIDGALSVREVYFGGLPAGDEPLASVCCLLLFGRGSAELEESVVRAFLRQAAVAIDRRRADVLRRAAERQLRQSQKLEAIGKLAGGVAHDFNNLLTSIIGFTHGVYAELAEDDPRREDLGEVLSAAGRATGLTQQLLAFSRQQPVDIGPLDLTHEVRGAQKMLTRTIGADIEIVVHDPGKPVVVRADPTQIAQILLNLAINARDAMERGGRLRISLSTHERRSVDGQMVAGSFAELVVEDTGAGMDKETLDRIFEPFFSTKGARGTGLGLATVQGIVRGMNGTISASSRPGCGTRFTVLLPLHAVAEELDDDTDPPAEPTTQTGVLILLVEDETLVRRVAARTLTRAGYDVIAASDGDEALALIERHHARLGVLFSDVVLPQRGGYELADFTAEHYPHVRILLTSGYVEPTASRKGPVNYPLLWKPYTPNRLLEAIRAALGGSTSRRIAIQR